MEKGKRFLNGLATALNVAGSALVTLYDTSVSIANKSAQRMKETMPKLQDKATNIIKIVPSIKPAEKREIRNKIRALESKIEKLYFEIGAESSKNAGEDLEITSVIVKNHIAQVLAYKSEIESLKTRLNELEAESKVRAEKKKTAPVSAAVPQKDTAEQAAEGAAHAAEPAQTEASAPEAPAPIETAVPEMEGITVTIEAAAAGEGETGGDGAGSVDSVLDEMAASDAPELPEAMGYSGHHIRTRVKHHSALEQE